MSSEETTIQQCNRLSERYRGLAIRKKMVFLEHFWPLMPYEFLIKAKLDRVFHYLETNIRLRGDDKSDDINVRILGLITKSSPYIRKPHHLRNGLFPYLVRYDYFNWKRTLTGWQVSMLNSILETAKGYNANISLTLVENNNNNNNK